MFRYSSSFLMLLHVLFVSARHTCLIRSRTRYASQTPRLDVDLLQSSAANQQSSYTTLNSVIKNDAVAQPWRNA